MIAIRKASAHVAFHGSGVRQRLLSGEKHLLEDRNAGSFVLLGLQGRAHVDSHLMALNSMQPLPRAWTTLALRLRGENVEEVAAPVSNDLMLTSLQALSSQNGNYAFFRTI
jgi:hypothetical protein